MKTILVLANKPITGSQWIAEHGNSHRDKHSHRWHSAHDVKSLEQVLKTYFYNVNTNSGIDKANPRATTKTMLQVNA